MPLYEYSCNKCSKHFEMLQSIGTDSAKCPDCGSDCKKLISATSFQLKGSGWYKTDYASSGSAGAKSHSSSCSCCPKNIEKASDGKCGA
jgi:putative FmdB family regulatory protein